MTVTEDDTRLLVEIHNASDPEQLVKLLRAYYHDLDRAERTSRNQLYLHLGRLTGIVMGLLEQGKRGTR